MRDALVDPPCVSSCFSNISEIIDALTLYLPMLLFFVDFETILLMRTGNPVFTDEYFVSNYSCSWALYKLEGWKNSVESQKFILLKNGIYLLTSLTFGAINFCYYHL